MPTSRAATQRPAALTVAVEDRPRIGQRMFWILAAGLVVVACLAGLSLTVLRDYRNTYQAIEIETERRADLMLAQAQRSLSITVSMLDRARSLLSILPRNDTAAARAVGNRLDDLVAASSATGTMWVVDDAGSVWLSNHRVQTLRTVDPDIHYLKAVRDRPDKLYVGPVSIGTVVPRPRFTVAAAITSPQGVFRGAAVAGVDVAFLEDAYRRLEARPDVLFLAVNDRWDVLAEVPKRPADAIEEVRQAVSGAADRAANADGWIYAVRQVEGIPITLITGTNVAIGLAEWTRRSIQLAIIAVVMMVGFIALAVQGLRAVRREEDARRALVDANETLEARVRERTQTIELLFRELNHRVKNNLQIVASLLRLQMLKTSDPAARASLEDSMSRIHAIADVHSRIDTDTDGRISLAAYASPIVTRVVDAMRRPGQTIDLDLDIADVDLPVDRAVLVAITLNEAVTNAFKHDFAHRQKGRLELKAAATADGGLSICVGNDGNGEAGEGSGLGASIISMLARQLHGTVEVDRSKGYRLSITLPPA